MEEQGQGEQHSSEEGVAENGVAQDVFSGYAENVGLGCLGPAGMLFGVVVVAIVAVLR